MAYREELAQERAADLAMSARSCANGDPLHFQATSEASYREIYLGSLVSKASAIDDIGGRSLLVSFQAEEGRLEHRSKLKKMHPRLFESTEANNPPPARVYHSVEPLNTGRPNVFFEKLGYFNELYNEL